MFGTAFIDFCRTATANSVDRVHETASPRLYLERPDAIESLVVPYDARVSSGTDIWKRYAFVTPSVLVRDWKALVLDDLSLDVQESLHQLARYDMFHGLRTCLSIAFPDKRLLQYDCGKLQKLDTLLRDLKAGGHRALIFTQMTRVLDVLEIFLNIHGHRYLRLDGATKVEQRQILTERFNNDNRILAFILSTRSGGLGINLTGADTVIFYDSDWNPSMVRPALTIGEPTRKQCTMNPNQLTYILFHLGQTMSRQNPSNWSNSGCTYISLCDRVHD
jgi:helicase SWR1